MDPNSNLRDLRANVQTALTIVYSTDSDTEAGALLDLLNEIAENFDNLDAWLSETGFLPDAWQANR